MTDINETNSVHAYESVKKQAHSDLNLKRFGFALLIIANMAALGAIFYALVTYCPIPTSLLVTSTFVIGVIGALSSLNIPTFGINTFNFSQYVNPVTVVGRGIAYLLFGPTLLIKKNVDWTDYSDPLQVSQISHTLASKSFAEVAKEHGEQLTNIKKYKIVEESDGTALIHLYKTYYPLKLEQEFFEKRLGKEEMAAIQGGGSSSNDLVEKVRLNHQKIQQIEEEWSVLQKEIKSKLPQPKVEERVPDFTKRSTRVFESFKAFVHKAV